MGDAMDSMEPGGADIGRRIFDLRVERDVQQGELASALHLHQSVLNRIEKGSRPVRGTELRGIATYFGVSADYLLGLDVPVEKRPLLVASPRPSYNSGLLLTLPDEIAHIQKYRALDERGRQSVDDTLEREHSYAVREFQKRA